MPSLRELQAHFASALLARSTQAPTDVVGDWVSALARFSVHRNNVQSSLYEAISATFPVVCALVGETFFRAMVLRFVRAYPPQHGWLSAYGVQLPSFLETFPPAAGLPYLTDVARLEWLRHRAASAPGGAVLELITLVGFDGDTLWETRLRLHPAAFVLRSRYPILDIWCAHQSGASPETAIHLSTGESYTLVSRPRSVVLMNALGSGESVLLEMVRQGKCLGLAVAAAQDADAALNLGVTFARLVEFGALSPAA